MDSMVTHSTMDLDHLKLSRGLQGNQSHFIGVKDFLCIFIYSTFEQLGGFRIIYFSSAHSGYMLVLTDFVLILLNVEKQRKLCQKVLLSEVLGVNIVIVDLIIDLAKIKVSSSPSRTKISFGSKILGTDC